MRCPICNNEMEQGFLQGIKRVAWVKKRHRVSLNPKQGKFYLRIMQSKILFFHHGFVKSAEKS